MKEGVVIRKSAGGIPEVVILGFIPADQRKFSFNFVFGLVLTITEDRGKTRRPRLFHRSLLLGRGG